MESETLLMREISSMEVGVPKDLRKHEIWGRKTGILKTVTLCMGNLSYFLTKKLKIKNIYIQKINRKQGYKEIIVSVLNAD